MNKETSNINLNIYDYTIDDLLTILNLQYNPSISEICKTCIELSMHQLYDFIHFYAHFKTLE